MKIENSRPITVSSSELVGVQQSVQVQNKNPYINIGTSKFLQYTKNKHLENKIITSILFTSAIKSI